MRWSRRGWSSRPAASCARPSLISRGSSRCAGVSSVVAASTAVMFGLMYLNTYELDHVFFSETRLYMAFMMGAAMARSASNTVCSFCRVIASRCGYPASAGL